MQLLEQLAWDGAVGSVTESDVLTDCSSILGYLECMDDMLGAGVITESVLMEGIDIKGLMKTIVKFIKMLIGKLINMLKNAGKFIMSKVKAIKQKFSKKKKSSQPASSTSTTTKEDNDNDTHDPEDYDDEPFDDDEDDEPSPSEARLNRSPHIKGSKINKPKKPEAKKSYTPPKSTVAALPMKSKDEITDEVVRGSKYPCTFPGDENIALESSSNFARVAYNNYSSFIGSVIRQLHDIATKGETDDDEDDIELNEKRLNRKLDRISDMMDDDSKIFEDIFEITDDGWPSLVGKVKSAADMKNVPMMLIGEKNMGGTTIESEYQYSYYRERLDALVRNHESRGKFITESIDRASKYLEKTTTRINELEKIMETPEHADARDSMTKMLSGTKKLRN